MEEEEDEPPDLSLPLGEPDEDEELLDLLEELLDGLFIISFREEDELLLLLLPPVLEEEDDEEVLSLGLDGDELIGEISMPVSDADADNLSITDSILRFFDEDEEDDEDFLEEEEEEEEWPLLDPPGLFLAEDAPSLDESEEDSCFLFFEEEEDDEEDPLFFSNFRLSSSDRLRLMSLLTLPPLPLPPLPNEPPFDDEDDEEEPPSPPLPLLPPSGMISMPPELLFLEEVEEAPSFAPAIGVMDTEGLMSATIVGGTMEEEGPPESFLLEESLAPDEDEELPFPDEDDEEGWELLVSMNSVAKRKNISYVVELFSYQSNLITLFYRFEF